MRMPRWILGIALVAGCTSPPPSGIWAGHAAIAGDQLLPIRAYLDLAGPTPTGYFITGDETTEIPEIVYSGDSLRLVFAEYGAEMVGRFNKDRYSGKYLRFRDDTTSFPFVLFSGSGGQTEQPDAGHLEGTYSVVFSYPDHIDSSSVAVIEADGDGIAGTIIHPTGDYGLLEGRYDGSRLILSRFTGWQAILLDLEDLVDGLHGSLYIRAEPPIPISMNPTISNAREHGAITRMRDPNAAFQFQGVTVDGDTVSSTDPRFQGNPIVIDIMGTWCHNCLDAAPLLQKAFEDHRDQGLQVISLAFENSADFDQARQNISLFTERFGTTFPVLFCGSLANENIEHQLGSQLLDFYAYPTTLFIDRAGKVVDVHTGFNGRGAGEDRYLRQVQQFEESVLQIVK